MPLIVFGAFYALIWVLVTFFVTLFASFGAEPSVSIALGFVTGTIVTGITMKSHWKVWTITPENMEVWYTLNRLNGLTRFYKQGLNFKFPWEKRVTDDAHGGVIKLGRTLNEEDRPDRPEDIYIAKDDSPVGFDWQFEWKADVLDGAVLNQAKCLTFIQTDLATKAIGLRARLERYFTNLAKNLSSDDIRALSDEITRQVAVDVFRPPGVLCEEEEKYAVVVDVPQFKGVLDSANVKKMREKVKEAELLQKIAVHLGKPVDPNDSTKRVVDEEVLVAAGIVTKNVVKYDIPAGARTFIVGNPQVK